MPVFGFGSEYWMWATLSHRGECTNLGRSLGFVWSQITISYYRVVIFLERILTMIQKEFDTVWTLCWMEGFALPPTAWSCGMLTWSSEVDLLFYICNIGVL